jgi:hypothetical protein
MNLQNFTPKIFTIIKNGCGMSDLKPDIVAGFTVAIIAIPPAMAMAFSYLEHHNAQTSITFAKSIMIGVPISWLFFLPFFLAERFDYGFWISYGVGILLLVIGFFLHRYILGII